MYPHGTPAASTLRRSTHMVARVRSFVSFVIGLATSMAIYAIVRWLGRRRGVSTAPGSRWLGIRMD